MFQKIASLGIGIVLVVGALAESAHAQTYVGQGFIRYQPPRRSGSLLQTVRQRRLAGIPWWQIDHLLPEEDHCGKPLLIPSLIGGRTPISICIYSLRRSRRF